MSEPSSPLQKVVHTETVDTGTCTFVRPVSTCSFETQTQIRVVVAVAVVRACERSQTATETLVLIFLSLGLGSRVCVV